MTTFKEIEAETRKLIEQYPNAVYQKPNGTECCYGRGTVINGPNDCGCVFGHVFRAFGIDTDAFDNQITPNGLKYSMGIAGAMSAIGIDYTDDEECWAECIQGHQDGGNTWGEALAYADQVLKENNDF